MSNESKARELADNWRNALTTRAHVDAGNAMEAELRRQHAEIESLRAQLAARELTQCRGVPRISCDYLSQQGVICGKCGNEHKAHMLSAQPPQQAQHPDDVAVDLFAEAMKQKLGMAREKGCEGWQILSKEDLSLMLREHVEKGDPRDVANFCMFLWSLGYGITQPSQQAPVAVLFEGTYGYTPCAALKAANTHPQQASEPMTPEQIKDGYLGAGFTQVSMRYAFFKGARFAERHHNIIIIIKGKQ